MACPAIIVYEYCSVFPAAFEAVHIGSAQRPSIDAVGILVFRPPGTDVD